MGVFEVDFSQPAEELLATLCELYQVAPAHHMLLYEGADTYVSEYCSSTHQQKDDMNILHIFSKLNEYLHLTTFTLLMCWYT